MKLNYVGRTLIIDITNGWLIMIIVDDCLRSVLLLLSGTMAVTKVSVKDSWLSCFDPTGTGSGYVASSAAGGARRATSCAGHARVPLAGGSTNGIRCGEAEKAAAQRPHSRWCGRQVRLSRTPMEACGGAQYGPATAVQRVFSACQC